MGHYSPSEHRVTIGGQLRACYTYVTTALIGLSIRHAAQASGAASRSRRQYAVNGERRSFALLRPITDASAQERVRDLGLEAFADHEERAAIASDS
jgi:hypothetical protein